jgi:hypothetical protein
MADPKTVTLSPQACEAVQKIAANLTFSLLS